MDGLHSLMSSENPLKLQAIDVSIESVEAYLLALKARRNTLVPISVLPPETLCEIFSFTRLLCVDSAGKRNSLEWINVTYVCHHWRNIALNSPSLWAYLPIGNLKWVEEMLKRSKDFSLVIRSESPHSDSKNSGLRFALEHLHRIRELSIRDISAETWHIFEQEILRKPALRLEHFLLEAEIADDPSDSLFITKDVLCNTDQLRRLELSYCGINWDSCLLRSLTHLTLQEVLRDSEPFGNRFVKILASMLELEFLHLYDSLPREDEEERSPEDVHLPRLRILSIYDSLLPQLETLFRSITFPPTTVIRIACHGNENDQDDDMPDFSGIIPGLARSYSNATPEVKFRTLILCNIILDDDLSGVYLKLYTQALKDSEMICYDNVTARYAHMELVFPSDYRLNTITTIAKTLGDLLASSIPLNDITQIYFAKEIPGVTSETIANTFGKLPGVRSVLAADNAKTVLDAITFRSNTAVSNINSVQSLPFPCLSSIYLHDMTFMKNHLVEGDPAYSDTMLSPEMLRDTLAHRRDLGAAIDKLTLVACSGIVEEDIRLLTEVVANVEWDTFL